MRISRSHLLAALQHVCPAIEDRTTLPILSGVLLGTMIFFNGMASINYAYNETPQSSQRDQSGASGYSVEPFANVDLLSPEFRLFGIMYFLIFPALLLLSLLLFKSSGYRYGVLVFTLYAIGFVSVFLLLLAGTPRGP